MEQIVSIAINIGFWLLSLLALAMSCSLLLICIKNEKEMRGIINQTINGLSALMLLTTPFIWLWGMYLNDWHFQVVRTGEHSFSLLLKEMPLSLYLIVGPLIIAVFWFIIIIGIDAYSNKNQKSSF